MGKIKKLFTIKEALDSFLSRNKELSYKIKSQYALSVWDSVVDEELRVHTKAVLIKDGILFVNSDSAALSNELAMREEEFIKKLNSSIGGEIIKKVVFKSGFVKKEKKKKEINKLKTINLTLKTLNAIDSVVQSVKEDELRLLLRKFLITIATRKSKD